MTIFYCIVIPFLGTSLGALGVYFIKGALPRTIHRALTGFAAGVMVAASIWSLLIPAINESEHLKKGEVIPAIIGFWIGILFLLFLDKIIPHLHQYSNEDEGKKNNLHKTTKMLLAVTLHNIPEGMAIGIVLTSVILGSTEITNAGALTLAIGIAIQNFPEGAIVSMPLHSEGINKNKAFAGGVISGVVEPIACILTLFISNLIIPLLPYLLSFAAGAMIYVVVEELIPEMSTGKHSNIGTIFFALGFTLMMALDIILG